MKIDSKDIKLFQIALEASKNAYAPYSDFPVGAALATGNGIFTGCNVENRSYGAGICAERTAIVKAVSSGCRDFKALAVAAPKSPDPVSPCGICRQVISEFCNDDFPVIFGTSEKELIKVSIRELFPFNSLEKLKDL